MLAEMPSVSLPSRPACPAPFARAPRAQGGHHERLHLPTTGLQGAVVAVVCRDIRGTPLDDAQRLTHFPASPLMCLSCFQGFDVGLVEPTGGGKSWRPFDSHVMVSGSQSAPTVTWAPGPGRGIVILTVDVAQALFGLDARLLQDRFVPAREALDSSWWPLLDALRSAPDDAASLRALERHLAPAGKRCGRLRRRWHRCAGSDATGSNTRHGRRCSGAARIARARWNAGSRR